MSPAHAPYRAASCRAEGEKVGAERICRAVSAHAHFQSARRFALSFPVFGAEPFSPALTSSHSAASSSSSASAAGESAFEAIASNAISSYASSGLNSSSVSFVAFAVSASIEARRADAIAAATGNAAEAANAASAAAPTGAGANPPGPGAAPPSDAARHG